MFVKWMEFGMMEVFFLVFFDNVKKNESYIYVDFRFCCIILWNFVFLVKYMKGFMILFIK